MLLTLDTGGFSRPRTSEIKKEGKYRIQTVKLDDFEKPGSWVVKYSRFRQHNWKDAYSSKLDASSKWITWKKISPKDYLEFGKPATRENEGIKGITIMGVRAKFYTKGYNWIALEPKTPLYMNGRVLSIHMWVWGGNFNYDLFVVLRDFRGEYYKVRMGDLRFIGWKHMTVNLKNWNVRQIDKWAPQLKPLQLIRFVIVSNVNEDPELFGIWLDDLEYESNLYDKIYYGKALEKEFNWE